MVERIKISYANCYLLSGEGGAVLIDTCNYKDGPKILERIRDKNVKLILLTHGHFDHTGAVEDVMKQTGATVCMNRRDVRKAITEMGFKYAPPKGTVFFKEGDSFTVGTLVFEVIETPGHSEGSVVFRCGEALFTGDTLFKDSCGRTDFPGCSAKDMMKSLKKLYELSGDYEVYPGHMEGTTLERERRFNYFMRQAVEE